MQRGQGKRGAAGESLARIGLGVRLGHGARDRVRKGCEGAARKGEGAARTLGDGKKNTGAGASGRNEAELGCELAARTKRRGNGRKKEKVADGRAQRVSG